MNRRITIINFLEVLRGKSNNFEEVFTTMNEMNLEQIYTMFPGFVPDCIEKDNGKRKFKYYKDYNNDLHFIVGDGENRINLVIFNRDISEVRALGNQEDLKIASVDIKKVGETDKTYSYYILNHNNKLSLDAITVINDTRYLVGDVEPLTSEEIKMLTSLSKVKNTSASL